jgi:hypothetical protein
MSRINGKVNWAGDIESKTKAKETVKVVKSEMTPAKRDKAMESILKKLEGLKADCNSLYMESPTSELSSAMTLLSSFQYNIDKIKSGK